uniref:hypothetical protein n=1 Tax=Herbidospora sakaeratensis TaxID=564415 RepID=UPI000783EFE3|nr:hypothetical protein [Herbidospora sakaeratensis]
MSQLRRTADPIPPGQARVLLNVGDDSELVTSRHPATAPLRVPSARIAQQAGLPTGELPGRTFAVHMIGENDADGFTLLNDPRQ